MKNMKRILVTLVAAVLLMAVSVAGTLAYLTSNTEVVTNTFVAGEGIKIRLDEGDVYEEGEEGATVTTLGKHKADYQTNRVPANNYKLIPGYSYDKDPIVHVEANSGDCYVFVKVVNELAAIEETEYKNIDSQMLENGWLDLSDTGIDGVENVWYYNKIVYTNTVEQDLPVFQQFTVENSLSSVTDYNKKTITIDAYAIQADGFATAADAWKAEAGQFTN